MKGGLHLSVGQQRLIFSFWGGEIASHYPWGRSEADFRGAARYEIVHPRALAFLFARKPVRVKCAEHCPRFVVDLVEADILVPHLVDLLLFDTEPKRPMDDFEHAL